MKNKKLTPFFLYLLKPLKLEWPNILLCFFLLSPLILSFILNLQQPKSSLLPLYTFSISILWLIAVRFNPFDQFKTHLFLLPFYIFASVDLFVVLNFNERFTASYMFIAAVNHKECSEFFSTYWRSIFSVLIIFSICYGFGLIGLHKRKLYKNNIIFSFSIALVFLGYLAYYYKTTIRDKDSARHGIFVLMAKDQSTPVGYLSQIGITADLYFRSEDLIRQREISRIKIIGVSTHSKIDTVVFVVGESSRPQNWHLFGYNKNTTPNLDREPGIFKFNDMCTTAPYTAVAVPSMLSLEPIWNWDSIVSNKSLVSILGAVGYDTYWLSTQDVDGFGGIIPHIAAEAKHVQYFPRDYDGAIIPKFEQIVQNNHGKKKAIFIHINGSHFAYSQRYPKEFYHFKSSSDNERDRIVAEYDNTILYTDWLLSTIINQLRLNGDPAILVYSSDHGENLLDDKREYFGHAIGTEYDLSVSAFIWASNNIGKKQLQRISLLKNRENQKISISTLSHTLLDMVGIDTSNYSSADDLLSKNLVLSKCPFKLGSKYIPSFTFPIHSGHSPVGLTAKGQP